jgi:hypothetical protein
MVLCVSFRYRFAEERAMLSFPPSFFAVRNQNA